MARSDVYLNINATDPADAVVASQTSLTSSTFPTLVLGDTPLFNFYFTDGTVTPPIWAGNASYSVTWALSDSIANDWPPYALQTASSALTGGWSIRLPVNTGTLINALASHNVSQAWPVVPLWQHIRVTDPSGYVVSYALIRTNVRLRAINDTQLVPNSPIPGGTAQVLVDASGLLVSPTNFFQKALGLGATSPTVGVGYGTGAGGTVTQATSRTTGVTLNTVTGAITLVSAAGSTGWQTLTVTNSAVAAADVVIVSQKSGTDLNEIHVTNVAAGSFKISFKTTGGTTTEQPVFNFAVIKGATA